MRKDNELNLIEVKTPFCKDCRHAISGQVCGSTFWLCSHSNAPREPVTGSLFECERSRRGCTGRESKPGFCGPEGLYFEAKPLELLGNIAADVNAGGLDGHGLYQRTD